MKHAIRHPSRPDQTQSGFGRSERGSMTVNGVFFLLAMATIGAAALDVSFLLSSRSHLQVAADTAAHAALYLRDRNSSATAKAGAIELVQEQFPPGIYGNVIDEDDIAFGTFDRASWTFSPDATSNSAVQVTTSRSASHANAVQTFLFNLIGIETFNVAAASTFETYRPMCLNQGFVAEGVVDIQSNNTYENGFCLHSNDHISLNNNNVFEEGTVVSMPDVNNLDLPSAGWDSNTGLSAALRSGSYQMRVINRLESIIDGLISQDDEVIPDYIGSTIPWRLFDARIYPDELLPGRIYTYSCGGLLNLLSFNHGKLTIKRDTVLKEVVLVTNCEVSFEQNVVLEDAIVATYNTSAKSITSPSGLQVGKNDDCAVGGGAQLLTMGSMSFAADLKLFGAQLIADQNITFTANAEGIEGASLVAGGNISGTSNSDMAHCPTGMENNFEDDYFRLVN